MSCINGFNFVIGRSGFGTLFYVHSQRVSDNDSVGSIPDFTGTGTRLSSVRSERRSRIENYGSIFRQLFSREIGRG